MLVIPSKTSPNYNAKIDSLSLLLENVHSTWFLNIQETHISKDEELLGVTLDISQEILDNAPLAIKFSKKLFNYFPSFTCFIMIVFTLH